MDLLRNLLDLSTLIGTVAPRVVHWASCTTCHRSCSGEFHGQWLIIVVGPLPLLLLLATALSSGIRIGLAGLPCF
jgi:hypothetical protein